MDVSCETEDASDSPGDLEQRRPWLLERANCLLGKLFSCQNEENGGVATEFAGTVFSP